MSRKCVIYTLLTLIVVCGAAVLASAQTASPNATTPPATVQAAMYTGEHTFYVTLQPGGSYNLSMPVVQNPVRIDISVTFANQGTLNPTELVSALVNIDPYSKQMTWIGTNNDGSKTAGNTGGNLTIASFGVDASLDAVLGTGGAMPTLKIMQNANATSIAGHYVIRMYY